MAQELATLAVPKELPNLDDLLKSRSAHAAIEGERQKLLQGIRNYAGNDPLKPWIRCIKWAKGLYTSGLKSELLPLLELCTHHFLDDPRYRDDLRYLRVWIRYADCCPNPLHVFEFLEKKKIGHSHSLLYEAYAVILELRGLLAKADEVYQHGISRQAQPVEQLRSMYKSFLKRKVKLRAPRENDQLKEKETCGELEPASKSPQDAPELCNFGIPREAYASQPHGDETIAMKKYADEAIVLGVDPEGATVETESHFGLVDPTINTKEAVVNVLSLFNQPLPLQQARNSRKDANAVDKPSEPGKLEFEIFMDDAFADQCRRNPQTFEVYGEELKFRSQQGSLEVLVDELQTAEEFSKRLNPWDDTVIADLLKGLKPPLSEYKGYHCSGKKYQGSLSSLKTNARNKTLCLGTSTYYLKGCTGQGAFAQVYQAHEENNHDETVVLKIQKPPCPWEFYIYCQLDKRIPSEERKSFGHACKMHVYSDCSIMVAEYGQHGTLQDVVNAYLAHGQRMNELLCMYYAIEMLRMLEVLHAAGIIHGDFKPDNLLIRNDSDKWEDWGADRPGCWKDQGLCLIDWGRSIDTTLFPTGTEFVGDSNTSAFRCIEMVEEKPWTYQVDNYGLCGVVHCMLHGNYMEIQQEGNGGIKRPRAPLKRYWHTGVWDKLFKTLLNVESCGQNPPLVPLRQMLEDCLASNPAYSRKLKDLLMKQAVMMYPTRR